MKRRAKAVRAWGRACGHICRVHIGETKASVLETLAPDDKLVQVDLIAAAGYRWPKRPEPALQMDSRDWLCTYCHIVNDHWKDRCRRCQRTKAEAK